MSEPSKNDNVIRKVEGVRDDILAIALYVEGNHKNAEMTLVVQKLKEAAHWCEEHLDNLREE